MIKELLEGHQEVIPGEGKEKGNIPDQGNGPRVGITLLLPRSTKESVWEYYSSTSTNSS